LWDKLIENGTAAPLATQRGECSQKVEIVAVTYKRISACCHFATPEQGHSICAHTGGSCALALAAAESSVLQIVQRDLG